MFVKSAYLCGEFCGDGHCIVNCFSIFFGKATSDVLNELWQVFLNNVDKNYDRDTMDLVLEALSKIYMHRIFIFENSIDTPPCGGIREKFTKCINLIKRGDHYNLVVSSEKQKISRAR